MFQIHFNFVSILQEVADVLHVVLFSDYRHATTARTDCDHGADRACDHGADGHAATARTAACDHGARLRFGLGARLRFGLGMRLRIRPWRGLGMQPRCGPNMRPRRGRIATTARTGHATTARTDCDHGADRTCDHGADGLRPRRGLACGHGADGLRPRCGPACGYGADGLRPRRGRIATTARTRACDHGADSGMRSRRGLGHATAATAVGACPRAYFTAIGGYGQCGISLKFAETNEATFPPSRRRACCPSRYRHGGSSSR